MKLHKKIIILALAIFLLFPLVGCKPSQEDFFELKKKQLELEQRIKNLEEENSKLKESIENFNPLRNFFENMSKTLPYDNSNKKLPEYTGELLELEPFVVNLSDPDKKRYMKIKLVIELGSKELLEKAKQLTSKLRDQIIIKLTKLSFNDIMTPEIKIKLREELIEQINEILNPSTITNLYFTELVVQ